MMEDQNKLVKLLYLIAFLCLAGISCWATAESLHMLLPSWPKFACWGVTVAFFIIASYGTKLIVDSLNDNIYVEKRGAMLIAGIIITLVFWLFCSMPTNTHTFFYRSAANGIAKSDIQTTTGYLEQLKNDTYIEDKINQKQQDLDNKINAKLADLETEIMNEVNPGDGPVAQGILREFAELLDVPKVEKISGGQSCRSVQQRRKLVDQYRQKIYALKDVKMNNIRSSMTAANKNEYQKKAKVDAKNLSLSDNEINKNQSAMNDVNFVHDLDTRLLSGYATIKTYRNFVSFQSKNDEVIYCAEHPVTRVKRLMSVIDVWQDIFQGKYNGHGFIFWIIISILIDVAAFIFFDLSFKRKE